MERDSRNKSGRVSFRRRRIGIDLDNPSQLKLLIVYYNSHYFFPNVPIEVKETSRGYHIRIWKQHTVKTNLDVRRNLQDDIGRLSFDENRIVKPELNSWIDTIFMAKWKNGKIISREEPCNVLSYGFWSRHPARKN